VTTTLGKFANGNLVDRIIPILVAIVSTAGVGLATILFGFVDVPTAFLGGAVFLGLTHSVLGGLISVLTANLFWTDNPTTVFGFSSVGFAISGSISLYLAVSRRAGLRRLWKLRPRVLRWGVVRHPCGAVFLRFETLRRADTRRAVNGPAVEVVPDSSPL
jgi:sugar phosphate permease